MSSYVILMRVRARRDLKREGMGVPTSITRQKVQKLMTERAQLVDVLPPAEYEEFHLPAAVNIPLKTLNGETTAGLDRDRPVVVY
jgi:rhodanese-related sulfurtransferase